MISDLNQNIIDALARSYKIGFIFLLCLVRYIFFGINVISTLSFLTYKNIGKMAVLGLACIDILDIIWENLLVTRY